MKMPVRAILGSVLAICAGTLHAQTAELPSSKPVQGQPVILFHFERKGLPVPVFTLQIHEDGSGTYQAEVVGPPLSENSTESMSRVERALILTPATVSKIFRAAVELRHFNVACESKAKNVADTGTKTLSYVGEDGTGSCIYNYSQNKDVTMLTDTFQGIAYTLDEGRRLDFLHRYDRLGLDAEMSAFAEQVQAGGAIELGTIEPTLTSIVADMALIQRVRLQAEKMLVKAKYGN